VSCEPGTFNAFKGESACVKCPKNSVAEVQGALKCTACEKG